MRNFKMLIEYDGTDYYGWQYQPDQKTIQGEIEEVLNKIIGEKIRIIGASRTDGGAHAQEQVANFLSQTKLNTEELKNGMNSLLPKSIYIKEIKEVDIKFNARYDAKGKLYRYRIIRGRSPLRRRFAWEYPFKLDIKKMNSALPIFKGLKNYAMFCECEEENPFINVEDLSIREEGDEIWVEIKALRFFYKMVRRIVGTLCDIGRGKLTEGYAASLFEKKSKKLPITAPPNGLTLVKVFY